MKLIVPAARLCGRGWVADDAISLGWESQKRELDGDLCANRQLKDVARCLLCDSRHCRPKSPLAVSCQHRAAIARRRESGQKLPR
jgi:hypothetical protein